MPAGGFALARRRLPLALLDEPVLLDRVHLAFALDDVGWPAIASREGVRCHALAYDPARGVAVRVPLVAFALGPK